MIRQTESARRTNRRAGSSGEVGLVTIWCLWSRTRVANMIPSFLVLRCHSGMKALCLIPILSLCSTMLLPADAPLTLELIVPQKPVVLAKEQALVAAPDIELSYRITNNGKQPVSFDHGGDSSTHELRLQGPGALDRPYQGMMTMEFRMGSPITIEPGKSKEVAIKQLSYGTRNLSRWLITKAGEYEASLLLRIRIGDEAVELKSAAARFQVEIQ